VARHSETTLSAIKSAVDIVALVGEYRALRRVGTKYKALCPFHDDHNPSLELNPERQSYKCWSCGAGGDIFDFVQKIEHVEFPEALRMLADRAGVALESPPITSTRRGPLKSDLLEVNAWAEEVYAKALCGSTETLDYVDRRGLSRASVERFRLGYAPTAHGWLLDQARRKRIDLDALEQAGLVSRSPESPGLVRERFRGRLMFPIHDDRGRTVGFGGRILPEVERAIAAEGRHVAKYLNTPETALFHKRTILYAADLSRNAAREAGWVAVVEGYTDAIAAHQVGLCNVVGTLGTALGEDHLEMLRRLSDRRVVLVFDGDQAGRSAADRALELFLASEVDLRVLTLPANLDPCEFLLKEGADAFRRLAEHAPEALTYLVKRASDRFDLNSIEGSRRVAEWVFGIVNRLPKTYNLGLDFKKGKVIDNLSLRFQIPPERLNDLRRQLPRPYSGSRRAGAMVPAQDRPVNPVTATAPIQPSELDRTDLELIRIVLGEPTALNVLNPRVAVSSLKDASLQTILQACYDLQSEGKSPSYENLMLRLDDPAIRGLVTDLIAPTALSTPDPGLGRFTVGARVHPQRVEPAPWKERLENMLIVLEEREWKKRLRDLKRSLEEIDQHTDPDAYRAIKLEHQRLLTSGRTRKT
jgi:DNA primase